MNDICPFGHELFSPGQDCVQCAHEELMRVLKIEINAHPALSKLSAYEDERDDLELDFMSTGDLRNDEVHRAAFIRAERALFRKHAFPGGRIPDVHEIIEASTGRVFRYQIADPRRRRKKQEVRRARHGRPKR